jgi:hypothetical protein
MKAVSHFHVKKDMSHKIQSRRCRQCHQLKPVTEFNAGFAWCKKCVSAYNAAYYAANKKKLAAYYAAYKAAHRKRLNVYYAAYYAANRKRIVARKAAFYYARKKQRAGSPAGAAKKGRGAYDTLRPGRILKIKR